MARLPGDIAALPLLDADGGHYSVLWEDYSYTDHFRETEEMILNYIEVK
jgi:hypothetical protein